MDPSLPQAVNPYAAPQPPNAGTGGSGMLNPSDAERLRYQHLAHEANLRTIGWLYLIGAGVGLLGILAALVIPLLARGWQASSGTVGVAIALILFYGVFMAIFLKIGRGLVRLDPGVRTLASIFSVLGLLAFPFGTLLNGWILYLIQGEKGKFVFSPVYQEVIARTPHIKTGMSLIGWIMLGLLLLSVVVLVIVVVGSTSG